jgi:hypothetical protein
MVATIQVMIAFAVGLAGGWWGHYKYGSKLASEVDKIKQLKL